jgi:putative inorganic carbon (HCO3(-)) transporter
MRSESLNSFIVSSQFYTLLGFALTVPFSKALANIFIVLTAVGWLIQCVLARRLIFPSTPFNWVIVLFVLSLLISFAETSSLEMSFRGVRKVVERLGLFFLALHVLSSTDKISRFIGFLSLGFGVILLSGFYQMFAGSDFIRARELRWANHMPRITSSFEYPDQYGIYLIYMVLLFGFYLLQKALHWSKRLYFILLSSAGTVSLFFTHSRAAWVAFFASLVFATLFFKRALLIFLIVITAVFFTVMLSPSDILIHKDAEGKEQSVSERFTLWNRALEMVKAKPLTGVGINTYSIESEKYRKDDKDNLAHYYAHNSYLQLAAESGLISLGLFLLFLGCFIWRAYRTIRQRTVSGSEGQVLKAVLAGTAAFLVLNLFETAFFSVQPAQLFYFFLALGSAVLFKQREERVI